MLVSCCLEVRAQTDTPILTRWVFYSTLVGDIISCLAMPIPVTAPPGHQRRSLSSKASQLESPDAHAVSYPSSRSALRPLTTSLFFPTVCAKSTCSANRNTFTLRINTETCRVSATAIVCHTLSSHLLSFKTCLYANTARDRHHCHIQNGVPQVFWQRA